VHDPHRWAAALAAALLLLGCGEPAREHTVPPAISGGQLPPAHVPASASAPAASAAPPVAAEPVRLGLVGDLNLALSTGRIIHAMATGGPVPAEVQSGFPFQQVRARLAAVDLLVGNFECARSDLGTPVGPRAFAAPPESLAALRDAGFAVLSVANNHTSDLGEVGREETVRHLAAAGFGVIGARGGFGAVSQAAVVRVVRGLRIALLGFGAVVPERAYADVARAKAEADVVVVLNHWGMEGCAEPTGSQRKLAHGLVDAGADVVVGSHAHIIQPEELYHGKLILYGLGDFVFAGNPGLPQEPGAILEVDLGPAGVLGRRFYRVRHDAYGAPIFVDDASTEPPRLGAAPPAPCAERAPLPDSWPR
jgi:poly-gamma-glutamate synthesis protein (capsule biosynthesis protein)